MLQLKRKSEKEKERETVIVLNWVNIHSKLHICNYIQHVNREMARWIKHTKCVKVESACHSEESPFPPVAYSRPVFSHLTYYTYVCWERGCRADQDGLRQSNYKKKCGYGMRNNKTTQKCLKCTWRILVRKRGCRLNGTGSVKCILFSENAISNFKPPLQSWCPVRYKKVKSRWN